MITIRNMRIDEASSIAALIIDQPLFVRYGSSVEGLARHFGSAIERGDVLLVAEDDRPRGMGWLDPNGGLGLGGYLRLIATARGAESRGIGAALLAEVEARTKKEHLFLLVSDFNVDAQRFYERHGYAQRGRLPSIVRPDIDELIYEKLLRAPR